MRDLGSFRIGNTIPDNPKKPVSKNKWNELLTSIELRTPFVTSEMFYEATDAHYGLTLQRALDSLQAGRTGYNGAKRLIIPKGTYVVSGTLDVRSSITIEGEGQARGEPVTQLRWTEASTGLRIQRVNTDGANGGAITPYKGGGDGSIIRGICFKGGYNGTEGESHGVHSRAGVTIEDCQFQNWPGNGIHIEGSAGTGLEGNANCFQINRVSCQHNRSGIYLNGADANAGQVIAADCNTNRQWGVWDSSFLGNTYVGCHTAANGWDGALGSIPTACTHNGNRYSVRPGQEEWCSTNAPTGSDANNTGWIYLGAGGVYNGVPLWASGTVFRAGGAYFIDSLNAYGVMLGCYSEADQGPSHNAGPTLWLGGLHAAGLLGGKVFDAGGSFQTLNVGFTDGDAEDASANINSTNYYTNLNFQTYRDSVAQLDGRVFGYRDQGMFYDARQGWHVFQHNGTTIGAIQPEGLMLGSNKVLGVQGAAVADATDAGSAVTQLNTLLARLRAHGLIAS